MKYAVKLGTDLNVEIVGTEHEKMLPFCYKHIGCNLIELVRPKGLRRTSFVMVIDEEGLLIDMPELNFIASYLYETHKHLQPIVGNVLIVQEVETDEGVDLAFLDKDTAKSLAKRLVDLQFGSVIAIRKPIEKAGILSKQEV